MQPTQNAQVHLIDDDASVREALAWLLRSRGLPSVEHASADDFLRYWQSHKIPTEPCCLLLDVRMPKMNGYDACIEIKNDPEIGHIPVVFLSAKGQESEIEQGMASGAVAYLLKPFAPDSLVQELEKILEEHQPKVE